MYKNFLDIPQKPHSFFVRKEHHRWVEGDMQFDVVNNERTLLQEDRPPTFYSAYVTLKGFPEDLTDTWDPRITEIEVPGGANFYRRNEDGSTTIGFEYMHCSKEISLEDVKATLQRFAQEIKKLKK
jgi:hypothetical protein